MELPISLLYLCGCPQVLVIVIRHHGIGTHINGENGREEFDTFNQPNLAMMKVLTALIFLTTKISTTDTA